MADSPVTPGDPFSFPLAQHSRLTRAALVAARPFISSLLGLSTLGRLYRRAGAERAPTFEARALQALEIGFRVHGGDGGVVPPAGPLIVAANHPTGAVDGLLLAEAVRQVRADVRILANCVLARIPELRESCCFVDPFGGPASAARSLEGLRAAHVWLRRGGALVVFPAGEVAWRGGPDACGDSPWHDTVGRLALGTRAAVLPAFLEGRTSRAFRAAGRLHPRLRTVMLGRELLRQRGRTVRIRLGPLLPPRAVERLGTPAAVTREARLTVDGLAARTVKAPEPVPVDPPVDAALLEQDVDSLPPRARLLSSGVYDVFCAEAGSIPHVLREIGRLRETTFRAVGEGTGRSLDLDRFDAGYEHLFVWNRSRQQIVGAYRVGRTDRIVARLGPDGLYTSTLFRYDERLLSRLSPALELGRSFVRIEYQRSYNALLLLWKGIGRLVAQAPEYRVLFGPVSISSRYLDTSQAMLKAYLTINHREPELAALVDAVNSPGPALPPERGAAPMGDIDELDAMIRRLESNQGVPVLLRQYLRLNASLLGFNVDPAFGDALDALMMVDLARLPASTLRRYLGDDEARRFLEHHAGAPAANAAA